MNDDSNPKRWWQTLPGMIAGITATVTALTGLVVAIQQTGWLAPRTQETASQPAPPSNIPTSSGASSSGPSPQGGERDAAPPSSDRSAHAIPLPAMREYKLGLVSYTLLNGNVSPQTTETDALVIRVRLTNNDRYDKNFWDSSFRLAVDGVPLAPESGLNEVVAGQAAKEGDVSFSIPHGASSATLKISYADKSTEIPLSLK